MAESNGHGAAAAPAEVEENGEAGGAAVPAAEERRYVAVALPRLTIDEVWQRALEEQMGSGKEKVVFHNRRGTGGDMHYATVEYDDAATAHSVASRARPAGYGRHRTLVTALAASPAEPTEVEVYNLQLDAWSLAEQFGALGPIVAHRVAERKMKAELVYASRKAAEAACAYDGKFFDGRNVTVRIRERVEPPAAGASDAPAAPLHASTPSATKRLPVIKADKRGALKKKLSKHAIKRVVLEALPDELKEKVLKHRKTKEQVMANMKLINSELKQVEALDASKQDAQRLGVLRGEKDRLRTKSKKLCRVLKKLIRPVKTEIKRLHCL
eukprot:TRINITY_DN9843_c0_g3_i2.p1 TRINITY_DN9843_c0_g3~~TRINITY_DN9843_c0_g3_i2.p1  ORF type:complete len:346 (+),score=139.12 TRINITY_DN9843_c0_g3_i2:59-1039(+)